MKRGNLNSFIVMSGDILLLFGALLATLFLRYGASGWQTAFANHIGPFSLVFIIWIIVFYISDAYLPESFSFSLKTIRHLTVATAVGFILAITLFYIWGTFFQLTPKSNLIIFTLLFTTFDFAWRFFVKRNLDDNWRQRILLIGEEKNTHEIVAALKHNPHFGYNVVQVLSELPENRIKFLEEISTSKAAIVAFQNNFYKDNRTIEYIYALLSEDIAIRTYSDLYEEIFRKVPVDNLYLNWFITHVHPHKNFYQLFKRILDITVSVIFLIVLSPILLLIALGVKMSSTGPIFIRQVRVGKSEQSFTLFKFRSMIDNAEKNGATWWSGKDDPRVTRFGHIIRTSHLDELPQLWNIFRGELSLVGPRPERPEFVAVLKKEIPFYEVRHLVKPGLTGWAQTQYRYGASVAESYEKLRYDIYYIKNRSFILDILIMLKTIKMILVNK